ncbi:hypothetical protein Pcinc_018631 [Petrolisthes cinctipes]|uniref:Uncharacterized protein n=1 Tax=Petrolisthes cinctipes TaxID=88211 RepID=A0AAE1KMJ5_PETCI|nr:hypothetical protein Pcinc_018631 [Petrolisthes cinctipes]
MEHHRQQEEYYKKLQVEKRRRQEYENRRQEEERRSQEEEYIRQQEEHRRQIEDANLTALLQALSQLTPSHTLSRGYTHTCFTSTASSTAPLPPQKAITQNPPPLCASGTPHLPEISLHTQTGFTRVLRAVIWLTAFACLAFTSLPVHPHLSAPTPSPFF